MLSEFSLNDPTQSKQIVVGCPDWIESSFACNHSVSRVTGILFGTLCVTGQMQTVQNQSK